jgi:hypothetical protein
VTCVLFVNDYAVSTIACGLKREVLRDHIIDIRVTDSLILSMSFPSHLPGQLTNRGTAELSSSFPVNKRAASRDKC